MSQGQDVRYVGSVRGTATYKVADPKVECGEATVIVVDDGSDEPAVHCLTCSAYKCVHAERARTHAQSRPDGEGRSYG